MDKILELKRKEGLIFCCSGPSGVGKDTLISELKAIFPQLEHSVSATTRAPRAGEVDGIDYHFCSHQEFERLLAAGEIIEYDVFCDNYYGTMASVIRESIASGRDLILDITVKGSLNLKAQFPEAVLIFILPPSEAALVERLKARRTEAEDVVRRRVAQARLEVREARHFDYIIINDTIRNAVSALEAIVVAEGQRSIRFELPYEEQTAHPEV